MAAGILARAILKEDPLLPVAALREAMQQAGGDDASETGLQPRMETPPDQENKQLSPRLHRQLPEPKNCHEPTPRLNRAARPVSG